MSILSELSDILLGAGALGAGLYCHVLSRRLRRFTDLERGMGGAVAVLSAQVDDLTRILTRAQAAAQAAVGGLAEVSGRAELAGQRLELLMASLHDLPTAPTGAPTLTQPAASAPVAEPTPMREAGPVSSAAPSRLGSPAADLRAAPRPLPRPAAPSASIFVRHPAALGLGLGAQRAPELRSGPVS